MQPDFPDFFYVLVVGGGAGSGIFVYSPAPGAGNLIASITAAAGTDPFGNAYKAGVTAVSASGNYVQMLSAVLDLFHAGEFQPGQMFEAQSGLLSIKSGLKTNTDQTTNLNIVSAQASGVPGSIGTVLVGAIAPVTAAQMEVQGKLDVSGGINAIVAGAEETWHSLGTLAGYTVTLGRYRLTIDNCVEIEVEVAAGGANAANVAFANALPAAYRPLNDRRIPIATTRVQTAGEAWPRLFVGAATGAVQIIQTANDTANLGCNVRIPLD